ncbi:MAG: protease complex subunit PrcB family protein [Planctomycetota bacterium]|jgi:hypothetical protein
MRRCAFACAAVAGLVALLSGIALGEEVGALEVDSARVAFRDRPGRDRLVLEAEIVDPGGVVPPSPEYGLEIEVSGVRVFPAATGPDGRWRHKGMSGRWVYRERRSRGREGVRKLVVDLDSGRFRLKAKRLDLIEVWCPGPENVEVAITFGGTRFRTTVTFTETRKGWYHVSDEVPPPVPSEFEWRIVDSGTFSPIRDRVETYPVALDEVVWKSLWSQHGGADGGPGPRIDFTREMVVGIVLAEKPTTGYHVNVLSVRPENGYLTIRYEEIRPGSHCQTDPHKSAPYVFIAVSPVVYAMNFVKTVRVEDCFR